MADERPPPTPPALAVGELALEGEAAAGTPPTAAGIPGREPADRIRVVLTYAVMFTVAALFFIPFLWSVSTSLRTLADTVQGFSLLPRHWTTAGYHDVFYKYHFGRYTMNSAIIAGAITVSNLFLLRSVATPSRGSSSRVARFSSCSCSAP